MATAGYLSRILRRFPGSELTRKDISVGDARQNLLSISARGRKAFDLLEERTERQVGAILGRLAEPERDHHHRNGDLPEVLEL